MSRFVPLFLSIACLSLAPACTNKPAEPAKAETKDASTIPNGETKAAAGELVRVAEHRQPTAGEAKARAEERDLHPPPRGVKPEWYRPVVR